jgi:N-terminal half of MaoC dehydratase
VSRVNADLEGKEYPAVDFVVDPDRVRAFGLAVLAPEGLGVPPTFATAAEFACFPRVIEDLELRLDFSRVVHGDQEYRWTRGLVPSERLSAICRIASIRTKGANAFVTLETTLRDESGAAVVVARNTLVERGS